MLSISYVSHRLNTKRIGRIAAMVGMKVLIADDNVTMRTMLERHVATIGKFDVDFAGNGNEALRFYRQRHHDLVIIDNHMPGMNGVDVLRELKGDSFLEKTYVIMITGDVNRQLVERYELNI